MLAKKSSEPCASKALYKSLLVEQLKQAGLYAQLPFGVLKKDWVVNILPSGFQKIRYYGFMSPNCKLQLEDARWLVWLGSLALPTFNCAFNRN